jgi:hypothetical protein
MRNISDKSCGENQNSHFMSNNFFFEPRAIYEIMWKNIVERGRPQAKIRRMRIACWILRLHTHSQRVMFIAVPVQQCLQERTSILRSPYIACLVESFLLFYRLILQGDTPNISSSSDWSGNERDLLSLADQFKFFGS